LLRWPTIAPTLGRIHTTDKAPCSLSCFRIQPISAPRIRLGVQPLVMNSIEVWFRDLALAHRERVSQERFFFLGRGTCQRRVCLFQVAGTLFTLGPTVPHVGHESVFAWISRPARAGECSCHAMTNDIRYSAQFSSRLGPTTSTCALADWALQTWGPLAPGAFGALSPGASERELGFPLLDTPAGSILLVHRPLSRVGYDGIWNSHIPGYRMLVG